MEGRVVILVTMETVAVGAAGAVGVAEGSLYLYQGSLHLYRQRHYWKRKRRL
jgi:hypothetical protein